ncbi:MULTISPECIES: hypothetical protein [unclassified Pseudomonas]|uniref:hypothetical protein n=1 Tax=unclassified Pseudomonas TaxID=196821 RepID=UPI002447BA2E|nr:MULTISPECIES: hypothetical protein [unclassified Pseudomonas]MDH0303051.1 hypothetical protein [Pseudomonas sp. GD04091]MDH1986370.1 hypothetical protein [Pseudomonas sp. GD03689]
MSQSSISVINPENPGTPAADPEVLGALAILAMTLQAHFALAPALSGLEHVPQWQADTEQWWLQHAPVLQEQLRELLKLHVRAWGMRHGAPRADIEALLPDGYEEPLHGRVTLRTDSDVQVCIPGCLALVHELDDAEEPFVLFGLGLGVWFDGRQRNASDLLECLQADCHWLIAVSEEEREALRVAQSVEMQLEPLAVPLEHQLLMDMQSLHERLVMQALSTADADVDAAVALEPLLQGIQQQVAAALADYRQAQSPEWLRNLSKDQREQLIQLNQQLADAENRFSEQSGHSDFYAYAEHQVGIRLTQMGLGHIAPADVELKVTHDFTPDAPAQVVTLMEWVCSEAYHGDRLSVEVQHDELRDALGVADLARMADELQLRQRYADWFEEVYQKEWIQNLLGQALDAKLRLALQAADFQGLDRRAVALLEAALEEDWSHKQITVGWLWINGEMLLTDHLHLSDQDIHVLYAPGSPSGDLQVFQSEFAMSSEIGALSATPQGRDYLSGHVERAQRPALNRFLKRVERIPQEWSGHTVVVGVEDITGWSQLLKRWTDLRVLKVCDDLEAIRPERFANPDDTVLRRVHALDHELRVLLVDYQTVAQVPTFMAHAREQVSARINQYPGNQGGWIDSDTVLVELDMGVRQSLTQVAAAGYPEDFNFNDFARLSSTVGQDLSHLNRQAIGGYIRAVRLGQEYCKVIGDSYLDPGAEGRSRPMELHRHLLGMKLQRDCLLELQRGVLGDEHAAWLETVCMRFHDGSFIEDCKLAELKVNGASIVEGYLLQSEKTKGSLIYLSDGPEGRCLFTVQDFVDRWREEGMQDWIYEHIAIDDEEAIRALNERVRNADGEDESNAEGDELIARSLQVRHNIDDLSAALRHKVRRLLAEAARDAYSAARRITQSVLSLLELVGEFVAVAFPPARVVMSFIRAGRAFYQSVVALGDGDRTAALVALLKGMASLPGATGLMKVYGEKLIAHGSRLWNTWFPGPSSRLSIWLKDLHERLKSLYASYEMRLGATWEAGKALHEGFAEELIWFTTASVAREEERMAIQRAAWR